MRVLSSSDDESESVSQKTEIAADGTVWSKVKEGGTAGRSPTQNISRFVAGPTGYAKRNIILDNVFSEFVLIIDNHIMEHIRSCTETEGRRVLKNNWTISLSELWAFIGILYARGAYEAKNLKLSYLWSAAWGPECFRKTMTRNKFTKILRFIRFDNIFERSKRLQTD